MTDGGFDRTEPPPDASPLAGRTGTPGPVGRRIPAEHATRVGGLRNRSIRPGVTLRVTTGTRSEGRHASTVERRAHARVR